MLVKVTFVQVRVLLLLGSENYSGKKIPWAAMPVRVRFPSEVQNKKPALTQKVKSGGGGNCLISSPLRRNKKTCSNESLSVSSNLTCRSISRLRVKRTVSSNLTPSAKYPGTTGIHKQVVNR